MTSDRLPPPPSDPDQLSRKRKKKSLFTKIEISWIFLTSSFFFPSVSVQLATRQYTRLFPLACVSLERFFHHQLSSAQPGTVHCTGGMVWYSTVVARVLFPRFSFVFSASTRNSLCSLSDTPYRFPVRSLPLRVASHSPGIGSYMSHVRQSNQRPVFCCLGWHWEAGHRA